MYVDTYTYCVCVCVIKNCFMVQVELEVEFLAKPLHILDQQETNLWKQAIT